MSSSTLKTQGSLSAHVGAYPGVRQPGGRLRIDDLGVGTLKEAYVNDAAEIVSRVPETRQRHPAYRNLLWKTGEISFLRGGKARLDGIWVGRVGGGGFGGTGPGLPEPIHSVDRIQRTEPITTHPLWQDILLVAGGEANVRYDDGVFVGFTKDSEDQSLVGVTDYLDFGAVFSKRYLSYTIPSLSPIGKIDDPGAKAPPIDNDRNWLRIDASWQEAGDVYSIREAWMLSARNGWHPVIYGLIQS